MRGPRVEIVFEQEDPKRALRVRKINSSPSTIVEHVVLGPTCFNEFKVRFRRDSTDRVKLIRKALKFQKKKNRLLSPK